MAAGPELSFQSPLILEKINKLPRDLKNEIISYINPCIFCGKSGACELDGVFYGIAYNSDTSSGVVIGSSAHDECVAAFCSDCSFCFSNLDVYHSCLNVLLPIAVMPFAKFAGVCHVHGTLWAMV